MTGKPDGWGFRVTLPHICRHVPREGCRRDRSDDRLDKGNRTLRIRHSDSCYARVIRAAFEDIADIATEGFSYAAICEAFEANGLLPEGSKPYSLSRAIRREGARRQKRGKSTETETVRMLLEHRARAKRQQASMRFKNLSPKKRLLAAVGN